MAKKYLLVVDMIEGFISTGPLHDPSIKQIIQPIVELINKDFNREEILFFCDAHQQESIEFSTFPPHCLDGSREAMVVTELQPYANTIYKKNSTNGFMNKEFQQLIAINHEIREIDIVGCCTDICILNLALSLKSYFNENNRSVSIRVHRQAVATYHIAGVHDQKAYHEMALQLMAVNGIIVV